MTTNQSISWDSLIVIYGLAVPALWLLLAVGLGLFVVILWRAQKDKQNRFDVYDLIMEDGHASKTGIAFMLTLLVSTWIVIDKEFKGTLDNGSMGLWLAAWVGPLTAKYIMSKTDPATADTPQKIVPVIDKEVQPKGPDNALG